VRLPKMSSGQVRALEAGTGPGRAAMADQVGVGHAGSGHHAMMVGCAVTTGLPDRNEHLCGAAAPPDERPGQGHRNPRPAPLAVLQRQLGNEKARFTPADHAVLAALLHRLPRETLRRLRLLVRPDTILRWHRNLITRRHAARSTPNRPGRPPTVRSIRALVQRLVRENPSWGYRRVHGELLVLGVKVAASTVCEILKDAGIDPAPERACSTWAGFLRSQAEALLACDFFETATPSRAQMYELAVIEHGSRRVRILGATAHPTASWVVQAAKNLVMDLQDAGCRAPFMIRDRDGKFPQLFDAVLRDAGIEAVLNGVRMPRMTSIMERWVQTCRRELLERTLIWNQRHLLHALRKFEDFYNGHRPHQGIANARPLYPLPPPITDPDQIAQLNIRRHQRLGGILHEYQHAA
jgi:putative transposase